MTRAGNREGDLLRRVREHVRGHGVVSYAEMRRLFGNRGAHAVATRCVRGEFILLARGVAALPGITMESPEYREFIERRSRQIEEGHGTRSDRIMAWAVGRGDFTLGEAGAALGMHIPSIPAILLERGEIVRVSKGVYRADRTTPRPLRARLRLPAEVTKAVTETADRLGVFCAADLPKVGTARQRRSAVSSLLFVGKVKALGGGIYVMRDSNPTPEMIESVRSRTVRRGVPGDDGYGGRDLVGWASTQGVFSGMDAEREFNHGVWAALYKLTSQGVMRRVGRKFEVVPEAERPVPPQAR